MSVNHQVILVARPVAMPDLSHFHLRQSTIPTPREEEVLVRAQFLSVDPYMRGRMNDRPSYVAPFQLNQPLTGDVVGEVVESKSLSFKPGDIVCGRLDWADYTCAPASELRKLDPQEAPVTTALGILGMPGMTAYFGLLEIGAPKAGETVVVSGAAGAVGSCVGQIAKILGCRVVGTAGGSEKTAYLKELGFDAAIDYKSANYAEELKKACPQGVDVYFDNVGGDVTDQVVQLINNYARLVICGQISMYNLGKPDIGLRPYRWLIVKRAKAQGYIIFDFKERYHEGHKQMAEWIRQGKIRYRESVVSGLENAPRAFLGLFKGENIGKQIVKI